MKLGQLFRFGIASTTLGAIAFTCSVNSQTVLNPPSGTVDVDSSTIIAQASATELMNGAFETAEAPTTGNAQIVEENGVRYLLIDSSFSTTDQAPDLHVLLDTAELPPQKYEETDSGRYINLGGIQNTMGQQRYPIPNVVNLKDIKSVVIWCRMADATMGFATLNDSSTATIK